MSKSPVQFPTKVLDRSKFQIILKWSLYYYVSEVRFKLQITLGFGSKLQNINLILVFWVINDLGSHVEMAKIFIGMFFYTYAYKYHWSLIIIILTRFHRLLEVVSFSEVINNAHFFCSKIDSIFPALELLASGNSWQITITLLVYPRSPCLEDPMGLIWTDSKSQKIRI